MPATGSLEGDLAAARRRRPAKASRRHPQGVPPSPSAATRGSRELLLDDETADDDERTFALKLAVLPSPRRRRLASRSSTRRRSALADRLARARRTAPRRGDRYTRSLLEHRTQSTQHDLEWIDELIAAEGRDDANAPANPSQEPLDQQGATAS